MNQEKDGPSVMDVLKEEVGGLDAPPSTTKPKQSRAVHVNFAAPKPPFEKAGGSNKRLKMLLWGDSGVGKTTLALQFPAPVVIDMEGGTDLYGEAFDFAVSHLSEPDDLMAAVDWLAANKHDYRTLVIDPVTVYWESLQRKWSEIFLRRNKGTKGFKYEFYDLQPRDWMTIKAEWKEFIRKLIALDMSVVVTAREKTKYKDGSFMQAIGETFDGEKSLPYTFDVVLRMYIDDKGRRIGRAIKDRSNALPTTPFEIDYQKLEGFFGKKKLGKKAQPVAKKEEAEFASTTQVNQIKKALAGLNLTPEKLSRRLADYGATSIETLSRESAKVIIQKLTGKEKSNA